MTRILDRGNAATLVRRTSVARVLALLNDAGAETRVVGGAVRNVLIGLPVADIDMTTTLRPEEVSARAASAGFKVVPTGLAHGTVTVIVEREPFEVTTLREDEATDGRHAVVRFGRDFEADARRRDFTLNALSLGADGTIYDYCDGLGDLVAGRVRFIGDATKRIREDYLRILRFFRFSGDYAETLDEEGLAASIRERDGLRILSSERVHTELTKVLTTRRAAAMVGALSESGLFGLLTAGVADLGRLRQAIAWEAKHDLAPDPTRRLSALCVRTEEDVQRLAERLRLSNVESRRMSAFASALVHFTGFSHSIDTADVKRLFATENPFDPARSGIADAWAALGGELPGRMTDEAERWFDRIVSKTEAVPVFPVKGENFLARGIVPGVRVGKLVQIAWELWLAQGCPEEAGIREALVEEALHRVPGD